MPKDLLIGIAGGGVLHTDANVPDTDSIFRMVKESGAFDYIERTPPTGLLLDFQRASAKHGVKLLAGGFFYTLGRDEPLMEWHLRIAAECGMRVQNTQIMARHVDGSPVTDQQVADTYMWISEIGRKLGVTPCFEVHVNMWSEQFPRVARVAEMVEARGAEYNMTLDHSHVIYKIDNPHELDTENLRQDLAAGMVLDPSKPGNVCDLWIDRNWVRHAHARPAIPNNPRNVWARHPDGSIGRGIQVPFLPPAPGEWHSPWNEADLEPWKTVLRHLMAHHAKDPASRLQQITVEMIPSTDYGAGSRYSIFEHSIAVANWLRAEWRLASEGAA